MAHKDLDEMTRIIVQTHIQGLVMYLARKGQSLGIAREFVIQAFDAEAEALDQGAIAMETLLEIDGPLYDGGEDGKGKA